MREIVCPQCRSTLVRRSKRAGFREEVGLRFLFAQPYRCAKCNTRFYRVGAESGFNLRTVERGRLTSDPAAGAKSFVPEDIEFRPGEPRPPSFWMDPNVMSRMRGLDSNSTGQLDLEFEQHEEESEFTARNRHGRLVRRRRVSQRPEGRSGSPGMRKPTKILIGVAVVVAVAAALLLYMFSLFSAQAKKQKLVYYQAQDSVFAAQAARPKDEVLSAPVVQQESFRPKISL